MFDNLIDCLLCMLCNISGCGCFIEDNIKDILCEVCMVLLEVDVVFLVVCDFISCVKESVVGYEVNKSLILGQEFVKIVCNELVVVMGEENQMFDLVVQLLVVVLMVGL